MACGDGGQDDDDDDEWMFDPTEHGSDDDGGNDDRKPKEDEDDGEDEESGIEDCEIHEDTKEFERSDITVNEPLVCRPCDSRIPNTLNAPIKPSAEDIAKHYVTHLPYRSWCQVCIAAKGKEDPHRRGAMKPDEEDKNCLPTVSMTLYCRLGT